MRDYSKGIVSKPEWLIYEDGWERDIQDVRETQFALANGFMGSRGVLEEIPYDAYAGTYLAGVYHSVGAQVTELVNFPNPVNFKIISMGEKIDVVAMDVLQHRRILDMQKGILFRRTVFSDAGLSTGKSEGHQY